MGRFFTLENFYGVLEILIDIAMLAIAFRFLQASCAFLIMRFEPKSPAVCNSFSQCHSSNFKTRDIWLPRIHNSQNILHCRLRQSSKPRGKYISLAGFTTLCVIEL